MKFIVAGYYTKNTPYEEEIKKLTDSCAAFNIPTFIKGFDSRGKWEYNCGIKPEFIFEAMSCYPDLNILYIDADGIIREYPTYFETLDADIGAHLKDGRELISNTVFIRNTAPVRLFIQQWIYKQTQNPIMWDQRTLQALVRTTPSIKFVNIPPNYSQIFDSMKHNGKPIIEHFQASRRFKTAVNAKPIIGTLPGTPYEIPDLVCGKRVRRNADGSFFLPRATPEDIKEINTMFYKYPGELKWCPRSVGSLTIEELRPTFKDKDIYIVGKGPSLDVLSKDDFPNPESPVIGINEAIHKIETLDLPNPLFVCTQDAWLKDTCRPKTAIVLAHYTAQHWYADYAKKIVYHCSEIGLPKSNLTAIHALSLGRLLKCKSFKMLCFDSCVDSTMGYAKCVGYPATRGGDPNRFKVHRSRFDKYSDGTPIEYLACKASGKSQP